MNKNPHPLILEYILISLISEYTIQGTLLQPVIIDAKTNKIDLPFKSINEKS